MQLQASHSGKAHDSAHASPLEELLNGKEPLVPGEFSPYSFMKSQEDAYFRNMGQSNEEYLLVVDKEAQNAALYRLKMEKLDETIVSTGRVAGTKVREGDFRTPSGVYRIASQENSAGWSHNGEQGAYGRFFSRLDAGAWDRGGRYRPGAQSPIAVHGTNHPELLGRRASEGCVRLPNNKNEEFVEKGFLKAGTIVALLKDSEG